MIKCNNCGSQISPEVKFCPFCGKPNDPPNSKAVLGCSIAFTIVVTGLIIWAIIGAFASNTSPGEKTAEDYESVVFDAFWETASDAFGVEYSDYKWTETATSYICDYKTAGGQTAHYYLIETAFETKDAYGQDVSHKVTARCYYVPEYNESAIYTTYITLDDETVCFDAETENWLMNMDGGGKAP